MQLLAIRLVMPFAISLLAGPLLANEPLRVGLYNNPPKLFRDVTEHQAGFFVDIPESSHLLYAAAQDRHVAQLAATDRQLKAMKAEKDSPYHRAVHRWIEPLEKPTLPRWVIGSAAGVFALLLLLGVNVVVLKSAVRRKTLELRRHNIALAESEAKFRTLFETATDAMALIEGVKLIDVNPAMLRMFGYADKQALQQVSRDGIMPPQQPNGEVSRNGADNYIRQALDTGHASFEWIHRRADGALFPAAVSLVRMQLHGKPVLQATIRDISLQKQNEKRLQQLNRALQTIGRVNHTLVHAANEADLLDKICRIIVEDGGHRMAWVGFAQHDEARSVRPVASHGDAGDYLATLRISWQDDEYGCGPTGTAIRTGKPSIIRDIRQDPAFVPWRNRAEHRGYASSIAMPLQDDDGVFGALNIYSDETDAFSEEEIALLEELTADLAFGIRTQRLQQEHAWIEDERRGHRERLQNSLLQTIQAITVMVEKRDPYTAGHQRRTSALAVAIADELQLEPKQIEGIRFGTMIHDIGNIYVPAEIISRPGKLSESERNIVHSHAQVGYDIVKEIDFPWPVAQMILQHHERLDGSGYPTGLKGDEILMEARIIAVVDVIEAMLSHRPYRPAIALEAVLNELCEHRGSKYDEQVVDASLRLFTEKGYTLPA